MSEKQDKIGFADVISLIAIVLLATIIFFGANFMTLGDRMAAIVGSDIGLVLMCVCIFLAAHAKAQERDENVWRIVQAICIGIYVLLLVPTYIVGAKFFNIQFDREGVMNEYRTDVDNINGLFSEYDRVCESRANAYRIRMQTMMTTPEGRAALAKELKIDEKSLNQNRVDQAASIFLRTLKGNDYEMLVQEKDFLIANSETYFKNWNILFIPRYVSEIGGAYSVYADRLKEIYNSNNRESERNVPAFNPGTPANEGGLTDLFTSTFSFSLIGLIVIFFLGVLGLFKYLFGVKSRSVAPERGDASRIESGGGYRIRY